LGAAPGNGFALLWVDDSLLPFRTAGRFRFPFLFALFAFMFAILPDVACTRIFAHDVFSGFKLTATFECKDGGASGGTCFPIMSPFLTVPDFFKATVAKDLEVYAWLDDSTDEVVVFKIFPDG